MCELGKSASPFSALSQKFKIIVMIEFQKKARPLKVKREKTQKSTQSTKAIEDTKSMSRHMQKQISDRGVFQSLIQMIMIFILN